jgi:metallophosphoesterase (TIGR00282 family)
VKLIIFWDIYGRVGRKAFAKEVEKIREIYTPDFVIANIENITSGRGPVSEHARYIEDFWVDLMTLGDHAFDNMPNFGEYLSNDNGKVIRPANFLEHPQYPFLGRGYQIIEKDGKRLLVIQLLGEVFMSHRVQNPFHCVDQLLTEIPAESYDACIVEFHKEATAEFYGLMHHLKGRAWLVYGTHTHVQTSDAMIYDDYTGWICDIGMNGPLDGVIGADYASVEKRFLSGMQKGKIEQHLGKRYQVHGVYVELDDVSWACLQIEAFRRLGSI